VIIELGALVMVTLRNFLFRAYGPLQPAVAQVEYAHTSDSLFKTFIAVPICKDITQTGQNRN